MGWGTFYEVQPTAGRELSACTTKAEWYGVLSRLSIESAPQLSAEESIPFWASKLHSVGHPTANFFEGDLHAARDEYDDPNVCFAGPDLVRFFLVQLEQLGRQFFVDLFAHDGPSGSGQSWLYEPLRDFLRPLCERGNAVVILWEN